MDLSRAKVFILLSSLATGNLALVLVCILAPRRQSAALLLVVLILLLFTLFFLIFHHFNSRTAARIDRLSLEPRLNFLIQDIKDYAIFLIDPGGRVMSWNLGAQQIKGYTEAEIIGQPISVFYTEEDNRLGEPLLNLKKALKEGRYESMGLRRRKNGSTFYADVVFTPIYDDKKCLLGFAKVTRDITARKRIEEDMLLTLRREKELNEMKSRFVTLASHEFKTPLSVILSSAILIEKYSSAERQDQRLKHVHRIKSNVNNLQQILTDFLSLEMLESGIFKHAPVSTDLVYLMRETMQEMEEALKEGQHVNLHLAGTPRNFQVDPHLLHNVMNNLLSNAIKYSPAHSSVDCTLSYHIDSVRIEFRDQGIGIPAAEQPQLFDRFFRATNTTGISGTGLGLSIVKRYLDRMGAAIHSVSIPGQGSAFIITLPSTTTHSS